MEFLLETSCVFDTLDPQKHQKPYLISLESRTGTIHGTFRCSSCDELVQLSNKHSLGWHYDLCYKNRRIWSISELPRNTQNPQIIILVKTHRNSKFLPNNRFKSHNSTTKLEKIKKIRAKLQKTDFSDIQPPTSFYNQPHAHSRLCSFQRMRVSVKF